MKIGVIFCAYGNPDYVEPCLAPWIKLKEKYDIVIAAVHGQFKEYHEAGIEDDDSITIDKLCRLKLDNEISSLYIQNSKARLSSGPAEFIYETEAEIRDKGLQYLLKENCDIIWLLDLDEFYTEEQIENTIKYIDEGENKYFSWFKIPMKNYILDGKQWIDGFCPSRIFKVQSIRYKLNKFYWDNDLEYLDDYDNIVDYKKLPNKSVPKNIINLGIKHMTWLHSNGKNKVLYQLKHFGSCSYKWNEEKQELGFDLDFYSKNHMDLPIIYKDE